jgi:tRNA(Ile)-lysidine synthase
VSTAKSPTRFPDLEAASRLVALTGPRPRVIVAFSGGVDSAALVHALARQRRRLASLRLVHVDHGLQAASGEWARHCRRVAREFRLAIVVLKADIRRDRGESPEAAARTARYALLAQVMRPGEVLVTAQHRDDQVETLLLQLFRGAGVAGLAAMPPLADFASGRIARPLLEVARAEIESYARRHRLEWIEDPSNELVRFDRNFLRHRVLPGIRAHWKGVDEAVARSARHMAEAARLLDQVARRDLASCADGAGLNVASLRALTVPRRRNALRSFILGAGLDAPSTVKLREMSVALLAARADAQPAVEWPGGVLRRGGGRLQLEEVSQPSPVQANTTASKSWRWRREQEFVLNAGGSLRLIHDESGPIDLDRMPADLDVRARRGGESLRPGPRARTQTLKKLLQAAKLPLAERARLPLVYAGNRLVAAGDRWIDASIAANDKSRRRARLRWTRTRGAG